MSNVAPELIVMLTHHDKTVENAIEVFEGAKDAPAKYWGFKEVGLPIPDMKILVKKMKDAGKKTCLEIVDYTEEGCLAGAKIGVECGFDIVMGTLYFDSVRDLLIENNVEYMPFVGKLSGRPSVLDGTIEEIIAEAQYLVKEKGIKGFDLLGYRYVGDAVKLNNEFVKNAGVPVCLAGSVQSYQRLDEVKATGAWAFTIGGAFFENKFDGTFAEQITKVVEYMKR
ncbi:MAG: hypothetical protein VB082_02625 [Christensenella sp.]|nr:hypothetical protein [Christensenella sp.]